MMMNLPSELVRRAAANVQHVTSTVTSTVSNVASAATGSNRRLSRIDSNSTYVDSLAANAKEKLTLTVKCTPNKDASTTTSLAIQSGFLLKRNEQGNWQKRYVCIVPHMFLYYFDGELAESPRGIIDLELYTDVQRDEGGRAIKLTTGENSHLRAFYFDDEDPEYLNEWITSFIRDRYHAVRDERNAYQQMQFEMTGAIDQASTQRKMSEREREELEKQLKQANQQYLDTRAVVQNLLVIMGITEDEMAKLTDAGKIGQRLKNGIAKMKEDYERKLEEAHVEAEDRAAEYRLLLMETEKRIEQEQQGRKNLEAIMNKDRKEADRQLNNIQQQMEAINMNFEMAIAGKAAMEAKNTALSEQKRVLVKEVKQLRKKMDESTSNIDDLKALNDKLSAATLALQVQLNEALDKIQKQSETIELLKKGHGEKAAASVTTTNDSESQSQGDDARDSSDFAREQIDELLQFNQRMVESLGRNSSVGTGTGEDSTEDEGGRERFLSEEERPSWELPQTSLKELGWISEEQNKLVRQRLAACEGQSISIAPSKPNVTSPSHTEEAAPANRRSSMSMLFGVTKALSTFSSSSSSSKPSTDPAPHQTAKRGSMLSFLGGSSSNSTAGHDEKPAAATGSNEETAGGSHFFSSPFSVTPATPDEPDQEGDRMPSMLRMRCLRCQGTVEGPKYSTCKCPTPALLPEDLLNTPTNSTGGSVLSGFSGLLKATVHGVVTATSAAGGAVYNVAAGGSFQHSSHGHISVHEQVSTVPSSPPSSTIDTITSTNVEEGNAVDSSEATVAEELSIPNQNQQQVIPAVVEDTASAETASHIETEASETTTDQ
eukprot:gene856-931_t